MPGVCLNSWMKFTQMIISKVRMFVLTDLTLTGIIGKNLPKTAVRYTFFNFNVWRYKLRYIK